MGSIVHRVVVQALHRQRRLLEVQGGGDERMDDGTMNESPGNKKPDERSDKRVKRTKNEESRKTRTARSVGADHTGQARAHSFAAVEEEGSLT